MARLWASDFRTCTSGTENIHDAVSVELSGEELVFNAEPNIVEKRNAKSREPKKRWDVGKHVDLNCVPIYLTLEALKQQLGLDQVADVFSIPNRDVRFKVKRDDNSYEVNYFQKIVQTGDYSEVFNASDDGHYAPLQYHSVANTIGYIGLFVNDDLTLSDNVKNLFIDTTGAPIGITVNEDGFDNLVADKTVFYVFDYEGNFDTNNVSVVFDNPVSGETGNSIILSAVAIHKFTWNGSAWVHSTI